MVFRVEVGLKKEIKDPSGNTLLRRIKNDFAIDSVKDVRVLKTYLIDMESTTEDMVDRFSREVLRDPVTEIFTLGEDLTGKYKFDWLVDVGFLPGVTDNEGKTAIWGFRTLTGGRKIDNDRIFSGRKYLLSGQISRKEIEKIASDLLANKLIQHFRIISIDEWNNGERVGLNTPRVTSEIEIKADSIDLNISDDELQKLSREMVLALSLEEMKAIQSYYKKEVTIETRRKKNFPETPTDCEVEVLAQTWSEHCKHKIFAADVHYIDKVKGEEFDIKSLFKSYIKRVTDELMPEKPWLKSVFVDNAGIIDIDEDHLLAMKVETHNSPSALDPYGGAMTGIVGVNRDIIGSGIGAKPIFNTDIFCFASPFYVGELPGTNLMHPARIFRGVHRGVKDGGNESGIPVVNGSIYFDNRFIGKPLVFCGTGGLMPKKIDGVPTHTKKASPGDLIVILSDWFIIQSI